MLRTKECANCGTDFSYSVGIGRDRKHCSPVCRTQYGIERAKSRPRRKCECGAKVRDAASLQCNGCYQFERKRRAGVCGVHKCNNPATRTQGTLCEMHYYRNRRTGTVADRPKAGPWLDNLGYLTECLKSHPLAAKNGHIRVHRRVAYDNHEGPLECFWCGSGLESWSDLHVDHLDGDRVNNDPANLKISCPSCNQQRALADSFMKRILPERRDLLGWW